MIDIEIFCMLSYCVLFLFFISAEIVHNPFGDKKEIILFLSYVISCYTVIKQETYQKLLNAETIKQAQASNKTSYILYMLNRFSFGRRELISIQFSWCL